MKDTAPRLSKGRWLDAAVGAAIFAVSLRVYLATLAPGLNYQSLDGNELATVTYTLALAHMPGYPFYTWLGKLFTLIPVGDIAYRTNLMSAVLGAAGVAFLYGVVRLVTGGRLPAAFAALLFAFSTTFWSQAVITEVYAPNLFMVALMLFLLLKWEEAQRAQGVGGEGGLSSTLYFLGFALSFGLSLGTHTSNLAFIPAFLLFVFVARRRAPVSPRLLAGGLGLFLLTGLQFLWLPLKAHTLRDSLMLANRPDSLEGLLNYTVRAFHEVRFAIPFSAVPDRLDWYFDLLRQDFGLLGMGLAAAGMGMAAIRDRRRLCLLGLIYLVGVVFFLGYDVPDIEVFFIPSHFVLAVFVGYGASALIEAVAAMLARAGVRQAVAVASMAGLLVLPPVGAAGAHYARNDLSADSSIKDFYANVFAIVPQGSVLLGESGVSGYDMFYFRDVHNVRPDVLMPLAAGPELESPWELRGRGRVYATLTRAKPVTQVAGDDWLVPLLVAPAPAPDSPASPGRSLRLYRVSSQPPPLIVTGAAPQHRLGVMFDGLELIGYDLDRREVKRGEAVHVTFYWRMHDPRIYLVATLLEGSPQMEVHKLGFDNLERYERQFGLPEKPIVVEEYDLVVLSGTPPGEHALRVGTWERASKRAELVHLGNLRVTD